MAKLKGQSKSEILKPMEENKNPEPSVLAVPEGPIPNPNTPEPIAQPQPEPAPVPPAPSNPPAGNRINKFLVLIAAFVLVVALAAGGFFVYQNYLAQKLVSNAIPTPTATAIPSPTATPDPTANWETYVNPKYDYSIKYPDTYKADATEDSVGSNLSIVFIRSKEKLPNMDNRIMILVSNSSMGELIAFDNTRTKATDKNAVIEMKDLTSDGTRKLVRERLHIPTQGINSAYDLDYTTLYIQGPRYVYAVGTDTVLADQILSTFKFTNGESGNSCTSVNLGISVSLPNSEWQCTIDNMGKELRGYNGAISLKSPLFTIHISSLGRGDYCSPQQSSLCVVTPFFSNLILNLELYKYEDKNKEIFGSIENGPTVSIIWENMEISNLSEPQKTELTTILSSITKNK